MVDIIGMIQGVINDSIVKPIQDAFGGVANWAGQIPGMVINSVTSALATIGDSIATSVGGALRTVPAAITSGLKQIISSFFNTVRSIVFR